MTDTCGCCEGSEQITLVTITNRPGLSALVYRVGTQATFFETMLARLSSLSVPSAADKTTSAYPLQALTTRSTSDPAIALLDAWAIMGDVFTFYQERIANEGYLRTATQRRSILELARLVGYKPGPGVASSTYLAYTLQNGYDTLIPAGSRAQSIPVAGQLPQAFETSLDLQARSAWSNMQPRMSIPEYITQLDKYFIDTNTTDGAVYLAGISSNLKPNDPVLFVFGDSAGQQVFAHVQGVTPHAAEKYTEVTFPTLFTPLVFLRNLRDLVDRYLNLAAFGVNAGDPGVDAIVPLLEPTRVLLELGEEYLQLLGAGKVKATTFQEVETALMSIGELLLWAERLLDLLISNGSPRDIHQALEALNTISGDINNELSNASSAIIKSLLQAAESALQQFLQQVMRPDLYSLIPTAQVPLQPFTDPAQYGDDVSKLALGVVQALQQASLQPQLDLVTLMIAVSDALRLYIAATQNSDARLLVLAVQDAIAPFAELKIVPDLLSVLIATKQALEGIDQHITDQHVTALVQAALTMLDQMIQTVQGEIDALLQAVNAALDSFLMSFTSLFTADTSVSRVLGQARTSLRSVPRLLVHASIHMPTFFSRTSTSLPAASWARRISLQGRIPPNPLQNTLSAWYDVYQNTATSGAVNVANWSGGLLNDVKSLASTLPGVSSLLGNIPSAAVISGLGAQVAPLLRPSNLQPGSSARLGRSLTSSFARKGDIAPQLLTALQPQLTTTLYTAYSNAQVTPALPLQEFDALRVKAAPFGSSAPKQSVTTQGKDPGSSETFTTGSSANDWPLAGTDKDDLTVLYLDARYDHIVPETWVVIEYSDGRSLLSTKIRTVHTLARADYGLSAKVTKLTLYDNWLTTGDKGSDLSLFRGITVYAQSEAQLLADVPLTDDIAGQEVELNNLYDGLQSGRFAVVSGERSDILHTTGVMDSELMMLASVTQDVRQAAPTLQISASSATGKSLNAGGTPVDTQPPSITLPGDTTHTTLHFATSLAHSYKRGSVTINGNVVAATQGETQQQILGSGSGGTAMQQFSLAKTPLTYIPAVTPTGEESTLQVFVNNVRWQEINSLETAQASDHAYITQADEQDKVTITFGDGVHGARLPTGRENVKAIYRAGIGTAGNVDVGRITQLVSRPLGVKGVNNPVAATGGADRESRDQARANIPLAATSLGRIVSVQDYADFARTFAGIGKASAAYLSDGQQVVYLTIAGQDDIPIDPTSGLYQSLLQSLHTFGDPGTPLMLALADVRLLVISARVSIQANYLFDDVSAALRSALLDAFSFARRDLGQPVFESEVLSIMQQVAGVAYVDLDILDAVGQQQLTCTLQQIQADELKAANTGQQGSNQPDLATLLGLKDRRVVPSALALPDSMQPGTILPAQLVFLNPDVQDTLILNQLTALTFNPAVLNRRDAHSHRRYQ